VTRFDRVLASTAFGLVLALSSHPGMAQQSGQQKIDTVVPTPDTSLPPPLTATDVADIARQAAPAEPEAEPNKETAAKPGVTTQDAVAPAAEPATHVSATADNAVADQLRDMIASKLDRFVIRKADREGVASFYKARNYAPLWVSNGAADTRAETAIAYLAQVDSVGLDPNDYPTPDFKVAVSAEMLAEAELKLTTSALTFARHAQIGRTHYTRVGADIEFNLVAPEPTNVLAKLADGDDAGKVLDGFNPPQPEFKALRAKLAELRKGPATPNTRAEDKPEPPLVRVPDGKILRPGMKDARVLALRKRLDVAGDTDNPLYDDAVRDALKTFQTESDLSVDGNLGPSTVRALNGERKQAGRSTAAPIDTIIVNMERWRWMPRNLGNPHVIVNVPDYTLTLYNGGKVYWKTKIVAGKPGLATPMVSAEMKFITVNPTWNVPPSIIEKEYLPALQNDPQALDRIGLKLTQDPDGTIHISQPPGAGNALGRIRFNFPNKFLVYQHDTPDKSLFAREKRAYSHGCMRVQNPLTYGEKLLTLVLPNEHYTEERLAALFGDSEININFPKFIPVHLTYQTAFVDDYGKLQLREDIYGRDARMIAILKGSERKVADIAVERRPNTSSKPVRAPIGMYSGRGYNSGRGYDSGPSLFDFLFGGPQAGLPRPPGSGPRAAIDSHYPQR
jgi:murein L,D-transpeptidase YcbB/YkuD